MAAGDRHRAHRRGRGAVTDERDPLAGCGDSGCIISWPRGMATNGGCTCASPYERTRHELARTVRALAAELRRLRGDRRTIGALEHHARQEAAVASARDVLGAREDEPLVDAARRVVAEHTRRVLLVPVDRLAAYRRGAEDMRARATAEIDAVIAAELGPKGGLMDAREAVVALPVEPMQGGGHG